MSEIEYDFKHLMAWVEERAAREAGTGCLVWRQSLAHGTDPQGRYLGKIILVRRVIIHAKRGKPLATKMHAICSCETPGCVEPSHLLSKLNGFRKKGYPLNMAHRAKISAAVRASPKAKLTLQAVEDIRTKQEKREVYALRYGIEPTYVNDIQAYIVWKDYTGNPFAGLGA